MEKILLIICLIVAYFIFIKPIIEGLEAKNLKKEEEIEEKRIITEEEIFNKQNKFEEKISQNGSPDSLPGKQIYIYKEFMLPWYNQISGDNRYKEDTINKIRKDWIDYMYYLEDASTSLYLSCESDDAKKQKEYRDDHIGSVKKTLAIEDGFASIIGEKAKKELEEIRKIDGLWTFSRDGKKAPNGFQYDLNDDLIKA